MKITRLSAALAMLLASGFYACGDDTDDSQPVDSGTIVDGGVKDAAAGTGGAGAGGAGAGGTGAAGADAGAGAGGTAARDGGTSDGGAGADGGVTVDGAVDAAPTVDGAVVDASTVDASTVDASAVDASAVDASAVDGSVDAAPIFTPGQIVGILEAANTGEINLALLAFSRTQNSTVLGYAGNMINEHATANGTLGTTASANNIVSATSAEAQMLETTATMMRAMLMGQRNLAFDRQYIQDNVTAHQTVLDLLNGSVGSSAAGTPLAGTVAALKTTIQTHLTAATAILQGLNALADAGTDAM